LTDVVDWVNIMMYDTNPTDLGGEPSGLALEQYKVVLDYFAQSQHKEKIIMGFEPGHQAAGGVWEGFDVDEKVVDYIADSDFGGVMFWAMNDVNVCDTPNCDPGSKTKENEAKIAQYTYNKFHAAGQVCRPRHVPTFINLQQVLKNKVHKKSAKNAEKHVAFNKLNPVKSQKKAKKLAILLI
jgi:hypothetical protein